MPGLDLERQIHLRGRILVAGVDEAGRGPLAGPVVAAAVILPPDLAGSEPWLESIDDSKRLSPSQREKAHDPIRRWQMDEKGKEMIASCSSCREGSL